MPNHHVIHHKEPLRGVERLEFARIALEEAVGRMVKDPEDRAYYFAVISRYRELQEIRTAILPRLAEKPIAIDEFRCPNCRQGVRCLDDHRAAGGSTMQYICRSPLAPVVVR